MRAATLIHAAGIAGSLAVVVAGSALALYAVDAVPGLLTGDGTGIVRFESIEGAERAFGGRLALPAFFPDSLRWPPDVVRFHEAPPMTVALSFTGREGQADRLTICQARGARASIPMPLMPAGRVLHRVAVPVNEGQAAMYRVQMPDGSLRHDFIWHRDDVSLAMRYAGPADELLSIALSVHWRRR
jgi:hypothetical protein